MTAFRLALLVPVLLSVPLAADDRLASLPRRPVPETKPMAVGEEIRTTNGQKRRVVLPDGSVLFVDQKTKATITARRSLKLDSGEVVLSAASGKDRFVLMTPHREVRATGNTVGVSASDAGTAVVAVRGTVDVEDSDAKWRLLPGQRLAPRGMNAETSLRASYLFDWTRELMIAAESPLVPASAHQGGSLVVDADGQSAKLALRRCHVDVFIEDGFARTTIDQTYFNHTHSRLEGTFHFPLPADASLSRLAMYVEGTRMEGGMVERDYGRNVYETIVTKQQDPALLEWVDGTTFKMRVFPLESRQEKRILISYTQRLSSLYGRESYRFPAGHSLDSVRDWSLHVRVKNGKDATWTCPSHELRQREDGRDRILEASAKNVKLDRDFVLNLSPGKAAEQTRWSMMEHDGAKYLMVRHRLDGVGRGAPVRGPRDWVFLFESSGDRDPLLARAQVEIVRGLLQSAESMDTFAVMTAGTRTRSPMKDRMKVTPENVEKALAFLESSHLIGALDLGKALTDAAELLRDGKDPHLVHVGSGIPAMGEQRQDVLVKSIPQGVRYVGIGVGRRWNRAMMKSAAEKSGGLFVQINPDEPISWRAFETASILNSSRLLGVTASDNGGKNRWLTFGGLGTTGEELCAVTKLETAELPEMLSFRGLRDGEATAMDVEVRDVVKGVGHLPRTWAKLEIDRLLAEDAVKNKKDIIALSKSMYVMTPFTSLLVLENDAMYRQYKVDRGRKDHWAAYECPEKIEVFREDEDGHRIDPKKGAKPTVRQVLDTLGTNKQAEGEQALGYAHPVDFPPAAIWSFRTEIGRRRSSPRSDGETQFIALRGFPDIDVSNTAGNPSRKGREFRAPGFIQDFSGKMRIFERGGSLRPEERSIISQDLGEYFIAPVPTISLPTLRAPEKGLSRLKLFEDERRGKQSGVGPPILSKIPMLITSVKVEEEEALSLSLVHSRPQYNGNDGMFFDLVSYAPGMSVSQADVLAVLEAEADSGASGKPGRIDDEARRLFENARKIGWRSMTFPKDNDSPGFRLVFDGQGRYVYERTLPFGIREQVVCDGETILHLYPDLHVGAKRSVSRFHRLAFRNLVPTALPKAEDLARGADLRMSGERTVAVVPHGIGDRKHVRLHLVFNDKGELAEEQVVEMPTKKTLSRTVFSADGQIRILDEKGKEVVKHETILADAKAPNLKADVKDIVVLSLPYRTRDHIMETRKLKDRRLDDIPFDDALALFAADFAAGNGESLVKVFKESLHARDQRQLGLYVLLAAAGQNLDAQNLDVLSEHHDEPLAMYLALHSSPVLRKHAAQWAVAGVQWGDGFLRHLAVTHAVLQRWQNPRVLDGTAKRRAEAIALAVEYVEKNADTAFGFALLGLMTDRVDEAERAKKDVRDVRTLLARLWAHQSKTPGLEESARYEQARALLKTGKREESRKAFIDLYASARKQDGLLLIDEDFRLALLGDGKGKDEWNSLLRRTARELIDAKQRASAFALVLQARRLDDEPLAQDLLGLVLAGIKDRKETRELTMAGVRFLMQGGHAVEAERLLRVLLDDAEWTKSAEVWRLAMNLASDNDQRARAIECRERMLDAEYRDRPEVMSIEMIDREYGRLLAEYSSLASAMTTLKVSPPADFAAKVVRTADRWRSLSRNGNACESAAGILRRIGEPDLAWDYMTTPIALQPGESGPWSSLAESLRKQGDVKRADEAYASAFAVEPTNAQLLWDRARNLTHAGRAVEAKKLLQQLAEGTWQPRFQPLVAQARLQLER